MIQLKAKDIMNTEMITIPEDMTISEASQILTEKMISGAPVTNKDGKLIGVLSLSDIARNVKEKAKIISEKLKMDFYLHDWESQLNQEDLENLHIETNDETLVKDIMTPMIFSVSPETPLSEMAEIMYNGRIHRLIVTEEDNVLGIVTTLDILKAIANLKENCSPT